MLPDFLVDHKTVYQRITEINPVNYARTRNYLDGAITHLSPFITHGIISTSLIARIILNNYSGAESEKLLSELAWREYFHRVWQENDNTIFSDLKQAQKPVSSDLTPAAIVNASTGIETVDSSIVALKNTGYMHNHERMWLAAICCNTARTQWYQPARWLYYHLLDGDLASNSLSWQWVAGSFSHRKYIANQENLNRYSRRMQQGTIIDMSYEELADCAIPAVLNERTELKLVNAFPKSTVEPVRHSSDPVFLYSIWNLDPEWRKNQSGLRILWIDQEMHTEFALSRLRWKFIEHWANAIDGLGIFVGSFDALFPHGVKNMELYTREYPATAHWPGQRDERDWCYEQPTAPIKSFSNYWKKARKSSGLIFNE